MNKGKIFSILTSAAMVFSLAMPVAVNAEGDNRVRLESTSDFENLDEGRYILTEDITLSEALVTNQYLDIDLDGKTLTFERRNNTFSGETNLHNGKIVIKEDKKTASGNAIFDVKNKVTLDDITLTGDTYFSDYAVFYVRGNKQLDIKNSTVNLNNETDIDSGGVIKGDENSTTHALLSTINITNTTMNLTKVARGFMIGNFNIKDSTITLDNQDTKYNDSLNGVNHANVTLDNSKLNISNFDDRGYTIKHGSDCLTLKNGSSLKTTSNNIDFMVHSAAPDVSYYVRADDTSSLTIGDKVAINNSYKKIDEIFDQTNGRKLYINNNLYQVRPQTTNITVEHSELLLKVGETINLNAKVEPANTLDKLFYSDGDDTIAKVDDKGNVTGLKPGKTNLSLLSGLKVATIEVTVYDVAKDENKVNTDTNTNANVKDDSNVISTTTNELVNKIIKGTENVSEQVDEKTAEAVKEAAKEGKTITTEVKVKAVKETDIEDNDTVAKIKKEAGDNEIALFLDLSVVLKAGDEELGTINKLSDKIQFTVDVPADLIKEGRTFYIIRVHNGKVERLETTYANGKVTFSTDQFSIYALAYADEVADKDTTTKEDKKSDKVKTGDNTNTMLYVELAAMALVGCAILYIQNKKSSLLNK